MRLKLLLFSLCISIISCAQERNLVDKQEILKLIRNTVPNKIPYPPEPDNKELSNENQPTDFIEFKYAIYSRYFAVDETIEFSKNFWKSKNTKNRFGKIEIDTTKYKILKGLLNFKEETKIEEVIFQNVFEKNTLIIDQQFINRSEKKGHGVDGIISFTNISFNKDKTIAAIGLGVHRGRLDSYFNLYILEKENDLWVIKFYKTKSYS